MATVPTVTGPIDAAELGVTLMHEHVFVLTPEMQQQLPGSTGRRGQARSPTRSRKLNALKAPRRRHDRRPDRRRASAATSRASRGSPPSAPTCNIVVATGIYTYDDLPYLVPLPRARARCSTAPTTR